MAKPIVDDLILLEEGMHGDVRCIAFLKDVHTGSFSSDVFVDSDTLCLLTVTQQSPQVTHQTD